jgi:hypothetical protein
VLLVGAARFGSVFSQTEQARDDEVLARVGPRTITVRDLRERIELTPWPGKGQSRECGFGKVQGAAFTCRGKDDVSASG